ncbi:MAG: hypothetical protein KF902_02185 [Phycisphaeraceae bacterium]|nr:hypothetical protein [Phycisphaeraceae bacterium]MCW5768794.1 hypothetical protein [Phycisphaeraceae bacterium]
MNANQDGMSEREMDEAIHRAMRSGATELPLLTQVTEAMAGRNWWLNLLAMPVMFAFFGLAVWAGVRFFDAPDARGMIMWAVIFLFSTQSIAMLKLWYWMLMNRNAVAREVKRLEFQVARLVERRAG